MSMLTPFEMRLRDAALALLETTPLAHVGWKPVDTVLISFSKLDEISVAHFNGPSSLGSLMAYVLFTDVDEAADTFKIHSQVIFAGRSGEPPEGGPFHAAVEWGEIGFNISF